MSKWKKKLPGWKCPTFPWTFFDGPLHVSCLGWEVNTHVSGQSNDCLRVYNVKMKKILLGQKWGTFPCMYGLQGPSINRFEFLGGLSSHLNHLVGSRMRISYRSFGTLPIGIFFSNLGSRQLKTSPRTPFGQIWHMSLFANSRAIWVLMPKYRPFRKSFFSQWRSGNSFSRLGVLGGQMAGLYGGTIVGGDARHLWALVGFQIQKFHFSDTFVAA